MNSELRIYVADLAAYNNGILHGVWIEATDHLGDMQDQINSMLASSPVPDAEEYAIHDYEGFGKYRLGEYAGIHTAHEIAWFLSDYPTYGSELLGHFGGNIEEARTHAEDNHAGCYKSVADFAEDLTEQSTEIPESLAFYIDYERMGRDMELNGDIITIESSFEEIHIFWSR